MSSFDFFEWPNEIQPPIYFANHQWAVTNYGLECLTRLYPIERGRLLERNRSDLDEDVSDWILHVGQKVWCDVQQFSEAFVAALEHHRPKGRTTINIDKSKALALRNKGRNDAFAKFVRDDLELDDRVIRATDLHAAHELYESKSRND